MILRNTPTNSTNLDKAKTRMSQDRDLAYSIHDKEALPKATPTKHIQEHPQPWILRNTPKTTNNDEAKTRMSQDRDPAYRTLNKESIPKIHLPKISKSTPSHGYQEHTHHNNEPRRSENKDVKGQ